MILRDAFKEFASSINLDETRSKRIQQAHYAVRDFLAADEEIAPFYYETFLQGSYRLHTAVKPLADGDFDVDVILSLNLRRSSDGLLYAGGAIIQWVADRLKQCENYKDRITVKNRCVRLDYAQGFHLDITPAHCSGDLAGTLLIPRDWKESHPKEYKQWCKDRHQEFDEYFYDVVRMFKWWRNLHLGEAGHPKSILLTTLVGQHFPTSGRDNLNKVFVAVLANLRDYLSPLTSAPAVYNPSLPSELLSRNWSDQDFRAFKALLSDAAEVAAAALASKDEKESIELWNSDKLFLGTFPKKVRGLGQEAKAYADALSKGTLVTTSAGVISMATSTAKNVISVEPTRFFGG